MARQAAPRWVFTDALREKAAKTVMRRLLPRNGPASRCYASPSPEYWK